MDFKKYYTAFLAGHEGKIHFRGHSHHFWPDVTREAMLSYWDDAAKLSDDKWGKIFGEKIPLMQQLIAKNLNFNRPSDIAFAPNTHELLFRLLSSFSPSRENKMKVITTDSEFHSFNRQIKRLAEEGFVELTILPVAPIETFASRMVQKLANEKFHLAFFSHVFFNSGMSLTQLELEQIVHNANDTIVVIDGYHGFMAVPIDLSLMGNQAFYLAGAYKYAAGGEGLCFMTLPEKCLLRPVNTGWFAAMEFLESDDGQKNRETFYPANGLRFAGSTLDFSALYRLLATFLLWDKEGITVKDIHEHVQELQKEFTKRLAHVKHLSINERTLLTRKDVGLAHHGHFFSFEFTGHDKAIQFEKELLKKNILTDCRAKMLRFGFPMYLSKEDIIQFFSILS